MSEQAWSWGISGFVHVAFMVAAFAWPVAPEPEPLWQEVELRAVVMERLEIPAPYIAPEPEPEPEEEASSEAAGGERAEASAPAPEPERPPERVKVRRAKVREAAPVVVERTEEAAAPVAAPVEAAPIAPVDAVAMVNVSTPPPARRYGPKGSEGGGGAQGEPVGVGGGVDREGLLKAYRRALYKAVDGRKQYPAMARRARLSGVVHVSVVVDGQGKILEVGVERSSGHALLDEAACEAVRGLGAMPAPPDGLEWARQKIVIPVKYVG
jgi:periplasmic protein TonB